MAVRNRVSMTVFSQARKTSRRCRNKMLRPFADSTLIDICLEKLSRLEGYRVFFGAAEEEFLAKAERFEGIEVIHRSHASSGSHSDPRKIFEILESFDTPFVCWVNPSHPFLTTATLEKALDFFLSSEVRSLTSVVFEKGWYYQTSGAPLTNRSVNVDTAQSDGLFRVAHAFHIYERLRMMETGRPWDNQPDDPHLFEIPKIESLDIDTEDDFIMVETLYERQGKQKKENLK